MIPILYEGTETEFTSQGLGSLSDATACMISEEINNTYELEMNYPMTGVHFSDIQVGRIILATPAPRKESEPFSIYKISKPIDGIVTIYAEHISYRLSYIPVKPFSANNCYGALNGCVENSLEDNPFTVWTDKALNIDFSFNKPQSFRLCLGGVEGSILDIYRGEYEFNRFAVKLHTNRGSLKDTAKIIYGKNLTDLKQDESIENTITGIVPYWSSTVTRTNDEGTSTSESVEVVVTLPEYVLESEYADKFPYKRTAVVDLSEYFQEQPTVDELRTRANQYMKDNLTGLPTVSLTVSFIDLARSEENKDFASEIVYLGDQVPVYFEKLGISAKAEITRTAYDVLAERYDSLTLGTVSSSLSKTLNEISKKQDTVVTQTNLQSALILAQKVMAGGTGGYIVTKYFNGHPSETFYGDTDNVDTMVNVIRINKNGIAFSNSGISGPYVSAWTIDGKFNADFIQAGKISGSFIEANSITVGKLSDEVQADISNAKEGAEKANNSIIDLQKQIDGVIETWASDAVPTLTNYPASSWTTNEDKEKHIGDLYYDKSNKCYRFMQNSDGSFAWKLIADTDVTKAIADAQKALDATDQSVTSLTTEYYASTSATELEGGSWSEDRPSWSETNYIWSRTKTTTKAGITTYSSPSCIQGNSGTNGKDGTSVKIKAKSVTYQASTSGTTTPTGAWVDDPPAVAEGQYLWTKTVVNYSDDNSTTAYSVAYQGTNGTNGQNGNPGRGVKSTEVTYQIWNNGTSTPDGTWATTVPDTTADNPYLWTRTVITYTDDTKSTSYSVGSTLKGVNVGGRNLIKGSKELASFSNEDTTGVTFSSGLFKRLDTSNGSYIGIFYDYATPLQNAVYTASINIKNISGMMTLGIGSTSWRDLGQIDITSNGVHKFTFKTKSNQTNIRFYVCSSHVNTTCELSEAKLELGNIATDWTPAPEDVDEGINNAQSSADKANSSANDAQASANNAQQTASNAISKADKAQSSADNAVNASQQATQKAKEAQDKANSASDLATNAFNDVNNISQVVKIDSQGVRILESVNSNNYVHHKSDGSHFYTNGSEDGLIGPDSRMNNLAVKDYLMFGAHRAELLLINTSTDSSLTTLITSYTYQQASIDLYSKDGYTGTWGVDSSKDAKIGDTVLLRVNNSTTGGYSFIVAKIIAIPSSTSVTSTSRGLFYKDDTGATSVQGTAFYWIGDIV